MSQRKIRITKSDSGLNALATVAKQPPDVLVAFWNGRPDFVDVAIATATVQTFVYLPNERGIGYALL